MDKENNRNAAGLRRSAVAERIRLREEWSELKGLPDQAIPSARPRHAAKNILIKKPQNTFRNHASNEMQKHRYTTQVQSDVLRGVVAFVCVGAEPRAMALRAALTALGASVVHSWNCLVTHLIWADGGCRASRAKARAAASRLVSPLWVEACAAAARRLPEQSFPAAARASDLPSPRTLRALLKRAEMENIPLVDLLSDSREDDRKPKNRLRISTDTSADSTRDTSRDTTEHTGSWTFALSAVIEEPTVESISNTPEGLLDFTPANIDVELRVNTAPRRALPDSTTPQPPSKSRRKLFTQREPDDSSASEDEAVVAPKCTQTATLTQRQRKGLARAERQARRLARHLAAKTPSAAESKRPGPAVQSSDTPRVVLTGMSRRERQIVFNAVRTLNGHIHKRVNKKTTHVLLGSCKDDSYTSSNASQNPCSDITGITSIQASASKDAIGNRMGAVTPRCDISKARTLKALAGAARGCRVLHGQWALDSLEANEWLHHHGYEVKHLKKMSEKARVERQALGRMHSDHAFDVFYGVRVHLSSNVEQKDAALELLTLCGAIVVDQNGRVVQNRARTQNEGRTQNGGLTLHVPNQDGGQESADYDILIGSNLGEVNSKWVFDSVAAGRMRTTRSYINTDASNTRHSLLTQNVS